MCFMALNVVIMVYSHYVELGQRQEQGLGPKQWWTIGFGPCPGSGVI